MTNSIFSLFKLRDSKSFLYLKKPNYAYAIYKNKKKNLVTGEFESGGVDFLKKRLSSVTLSSPQYEPLVFHLYYELGFIIENINEVKDDTLLAIVISYKDSSIINISNKKKLSLSKTKSESLENYKKKFNQVQWNLRKGNCYQLNLTKVFEYSFEGYSDRDFISALFSGDSVSQYAHATSIQREGKLILSNSPECLFTIRGNEIATMPIKGTAEQTDKSFNKLMNSKKDQGELYMITDLMRNDLTKIEMSPSKVILKKAKLKVPKIWHQYSLISTTLKSSTSMWDIISNIFPGGSITGAPKKKAIKLLNEIEKENRGIYCGSTLLVHKSLKAASINIRTAEIDLNSGSMRYGSGGGITLLSETNSEYQEMLLKLESFLSILN